MEREACKTHVHTSPTIASTVDLHCKVCYFPRYTSSHPYEVTTKGHNPYDTIYDDITEFSKKGDILLRGDFNAHIGDRQVSLLDFASNSLIVPELDPVELGIVRCLVLVDHSAIVGLPYKASPGTHPTMLWEG